MEFIPTAHSDAWFSLLGIPVVAVVVLGGFLTVVVFFSGLTFVANDDVEVRWFGIFLMLAAAAAGVYLGWLALSVSSDGAARDERVAAAIGDEYGIDVSGSQVRSLQYPDRQPSAEFEVFGSFQQEVPTDSGFERATVYLLWKNGQFELAGSEDGRTFTTLEHVGRVVTVD